MANVRLSRVALIALLGGLLASAWATAAAPERLLSAAGRLNAPLDLALDARANHAYVLGADGDVEDVTLTPAWRVAAVARLNTLANATALVYRAADASLLVASANRVIALSLDDKTARPLPPSFSSVVVGLALDEVGDALFVATQTGEITRLRLSDNTSEVLGNVGQALSDLAYDPTRKLLYASTPRGTLLSFDPSSAKVERLAFVGPPLGRLDLDGGRLYVTSIDFGLYTLDLELTAPKPTLFFPRVAGPSAIAVRGQRALVTNVGEGLVLLDPIDLSHALGSSAQVVLPPTLGPVRSLAIDAARGIALSSDAAFTLWSLSTDPFEIVSFVLTPFDGRVIVSPRETRLFATNREGGQVLAMRFDPPFRFSFDQPPISPVLVSGLPDPDGLAYWEGENVLFVGTRGDHALWRVDVARREAKKLVSLPSGFSSIDLALVNDLLFIVLNRTEGKDSGVLLRYALRDERLDERPLLLGLSNPVDLAVAGTCVLIVSNERLLALELGSLNRRVVFEQAGLSAVAVDGGALYWGTQQGELYRTPLSSVGLGKEGPCSG